MSSQSPLLPLLIGAAAGTVAGYLLAKLLNQSSRPAPVKHVFLGRFKESTTPEEREELIKGYMALPNTVHSMKAFEWGTNVSVEGLDKGFTHVFVTTFDDEKGRDEYLKHVDHVTFAQQLLGHVVDVVVVDYVPKIIK